MLTLFLSSLYLLPLLSLSLSLSLSSSTLPSTAFSSALSSPPPTFSSNDPSNHTISTLMCSSDPFLFFSLSLPVLLSHLKPTRDRRKQPPGPPVCAVIATSTSWVPSPTVLFSLSRSAVDPSCPCNWDRSLRLSSLPLKLSGFSYKRLILRCKRDDRFDVKGIIQVAQDIRGFLFFVFYGLELLGVQNKKFPLLVHSLLSKQWKVG